MAGGTQIPIAVCYDHERLFVAPSGACTVAICGGLKDYLNYYKKPATTDIYFDLSHATGMDSTFIGFLLSLATRKNDPTSPALHLVAPSDSAMEALRRMYVLPLFDVCPTRPETALPWLPLSVDKPEAGKTADLVVETHEKLIEADSRNAPSCKPVVEGFRAEREKKD